MNNLNYTVIRDAESFVQTLTQFYCIQNLVGICVCRWIGELWWSIWLFIKLTRVKIILRKGQKIQRFNEIIISNFFIQVMVLFNNNSIFMEHLFCLLLFEKSFKLKRQMQSHWKVKTADIDEARTFFTYIIQLVKKGFFFILKI